MLASIPGTQQAKESVIANQVPQVAAVKRREATLEVRYDGQPKFIPIEGTSMEYAVNTSAEVIHTEGRYYAVHNAVWFVANSPMGPWIVADFIPAEIYRIPPSCPLFHDRYVYVYGATPDVVYFGYTPGYLGAFISDGVVVFGTGWLYPGWIGDYYFGWPWTWGFGFHFSYWVGGWAWRPMGSFWWYHEPWYMHRLYYGHWNPHWRPGDREWFRNNVNVYNRWPGNTLVTRGGIQGRIGPAGRPRPSPRPPGDFYAGRDGRVYERRQNGWYQQNNSGNWAKVRPNPGLNQQQQSRTLGEARQREFQNRGPSPGVPRTNAPSPRGGARAPAGGGRRR